jgi:cell division protein FtsW (lipid II flippase)
VVIRFVFAAIAEEWGLLGVIVVIACWDLVMHGLRIATLQQAGLSSFCPSVSVCRGVRPAHHAGLLRLLPLTGVTLPFLSYRQFAAGSFVTVDFC